MHTVNVSRMYSLLHYWHGWPAVSEQTGSVLFMCRINIPRLSKETDERVHVSIMFQSQVQQQDCILKIQSVSYIQGFSNRSCKFKTFQF